MVVRVFSLIHNSNVLHNVSISNNFYFLSVFCSFCAILFFLCYFVLFVLVKHFICHRIFDGCLSVVWELTGVLVCGFTGEVV